MTDCTAAKQGPGGHAKGQQGMTDCTAAKQGPGGHAKGRHGLTLHAEWTKLRTSPGTPWLLLAVVVSTVAVSLTTAALAPAGDGADPVRVSLTGIQLGQAVVAILAVLMIGGEYGTGMIRITLAAMPRRTTVLTAKAVVLAGVVLVAAAIAVPASLLLSPLSLGDGPVLRAAGGSVLYLALIGLLSLGIGTAVRNAAAAVGVVLGLLFVFPLLIPAVTDPDWQRHLKQLGPTTAGLAIQATTGLDSLPISPWRGLAVLAAWAAAALLAGGLLFRLRDA
jgi:ABC-2 type transport system permease protein